MERRLKEKEMNIWYAVITKMNKMGDRYDNDPSFNLEEAKRLYPELGVWQVEQEMSGGVAVNVSIPRAWEEAMFKVGGEHEGELRIKRGGGYFLSIDPGEAIL